MGRRVELHSLASFQAHLDVRLLLMLMFLALATRLSAKRHDRRTPSKPGIAPIAPPIRAASSSGLTGSSSSRPGPRGSNSGCWQCISRPARPTATLLGVRVPHRFRRSQHRPPIHAGAGSYLIDVELLPSYLKRDPGTGDLHDFL